MLTWRCFRHAPCSRVSGFKQNVVSHNTTSILQFHAMSSWSDDDDDVPPISNAPLSFPDCLNGRTVLLAIVADGILQTPAQLRAQIMRVLELIKAEALLFAQRSPRSQHRRQQALPPLASVFVEYAPCERVRLIFPCVATTCQRLATAPAGVYVMYRTTGRWAGGIMERVTRGRVRRVQVLLQRRASCAVRCACRASACVSRVFLTLAAGNCCWF